MRTSAPMSHPFRSEVLPSGRDTIPGSTSMTDNAVLLRPVLEPEAQAFSDATATPPFLADLGPEKGRIAVDDVQSGEIAKPAIDEEWITVPGGPTGEVKVRIVKPAGAQGTLP